MEKERKGAGNNEMQRILDIWIKNSVQDNNKDNLSELKLTVSPYIKLPYPKGVMLDVIIALSPLLQVWIQGPRAFLIALLEY